MALRLALDVNRYSDFCRGDMETVEHVRRAAQILFPFIVIAEIRVGFRLGTRTAENEQILANFLRENDVDVVYPDDATTHMYASLFAQLRAAGKPIPTNDLWIAAIVLQHGLTLHSRDKHFDYLPQLPRV